MDGHGGRRIARAAPRQGHAAHRKAPAIAYPVTATTGAVKSMWMPLIVAPATVSTAAPGSPGLSAQVKLTVTSLLSSPPGTLSWRAPTRVLSAIADAIEESVEFLAVEWCDVPARQRYPSQAAAGDAVVDVEVIACEYLAGMTLNAGDSL